MNKFGLLIIVFILASACQSGKEAGIPSPGSYSQLKEWFADPPSDYRSAPLWVWNDQITRAGISLQLEEFKNAGIGGVFVHPRPGLITEYISEDWHRLFDFTVQKGKELGLKVWIYDENSYPSGFAGGHVPAQMPDSYRHGTGLAFEVLDVLNIEPNDTIEAVLKQSGDAFEDITDKIQSEKGETGKYYVFRRTYPGSSLWYGGKTYVDLLYEGVTDKFMQITMQGYEKYNKDDFGKTLMGIFTDEPNLEAAIGPGTAFRWTPDLWDAFMERWSYDLRLNLPSLVDEVGNWKKVRHDYYELLLEMFIDRWAKPWFEYCDENKLKWTGHYWEHGWPRPTDGSDEAAFYIWHQQPGVDMLGNELIDKGQGGQFGNTRAVRELHSAANQAGRNRTLSETYGGGGWDMDFKSFKRLVDWQGVLGVNFVNQHLSYYTLKGVRKFDYPPSFSYHEPWWDSYAAMGDYIGRISMAMSAGEQINTTLVLQPNTTAWMYFSRTKDHPALDRIQHGFKDFVYRLERKHIEYDLGSELVLRTIGSVNQDRLVVGQREYKLVVIPEEMESIDRATCELLREYLAGGGMVLSFRDQIPRVDGEENDDVIRLQEKYNDQWILVNGLDDPTCDELLYNGSFTIDGKSDGGELYHQRRILEDGQLLFLVNTDVYSKSRAVIKASGKSLLKMDLENGQIHSVPSAPKDGSLSFEIQLDPVGSALYFISSKTENEPELPMEEPAGDIVPGTGEISVTPETDNILVLNYLDLKTPKTEMKDTYFMTALISLFTENGIEFGNPWQHKIQYKKEYLEMDTFPVNSGFTAAYHFRIAEGTDLSGLSDIKTVVERPELWSVSINGSIVEKENGKFWIDRDFPVYGIGQFIRLGDNTITLKAERMSIFAELMPVYVLGDFKVVPKDTGFEIGNGSLDSLGSWKDKGYIFYSGKVRYFQKFNISKGDSKYRIKLNGWKGTVAEVWVNNTKAGIIAWSPEELDITNLLNEGDNEIAIRVVGSLKNTFGQFYQEEKSWIYGPHDWNNAPEHQPSYDQYFLPDYGLMEPFELVRTVN